MEEVQWATAPAAENAPATVSIVLAIVLPLCCPVPAGGDSMPQRVVGGGMLIPLCFHRLVHRDHHYIIIFIIIIIHHHRSEPPART